ncbi:uncharacterized protein CELE_C49C3.6 [Caenorhabditis elegans]|uniref:Uncharacterized protein n=1 Tax=Caenorhabditis elegans TaxID=6239 RepID=Q9XUF8_CAEEL|nr:Uncharacterized protein CELE_C49C3.6 [Caenorhabditis elegans]CAB05160.1 Uncharacterized protein CELE_C49C3.6 [Caenorhabditis elegans]|eukprot:NP_503082.1 Uncharacterized protein CELE_C49C3.6 [Caenorhabditis elegans]
MPLSKRRAAGRINGLKGPPAKKRKEIERHEALLMHPLAYTAEQYEQVAEESKFYKNCFETTAAENVELLKSNDQLKKELELLKNQQGNQLKVDMKFKSQIESTRQSNMTLLREREIWQNRYYDVLAEKLALSARVKSMMGDIVESVEVPNDSNGNTWELREDLEIDRSARRKTEEEPKAQKMNSTRGSLPRNQCSTRSNNQTPNEMLLKMAIGLDTTSVN